MYYQMSMEGLVLTGQLDAGFALLQRIAEPLLASEQDCFPLYRTLLEGFRCAGEAERASSLQAEVRRLGLRAFQPVATVHVGAEERCFEYGGTGEGAGAARKLWSEVRRRTAYTPQLQSVPLGLVQRSTRARQERSLQVHAEKKALAVLLLEEVHAGAERDHESEGEVGEELDVTISCDACADCHAFFKSASLMLGRTIILSQPRMVHTFADGRCSCGQ